MTTIRVAVPSHAGTHYDVVLRAGALADLAALLADAAPAAAYAVIVPHTIQNYGANAVNALHAANMPATLFPFSDGEVHKTRETWAALSDAMLAGRFGRDCCVIALGGGVTGDIAGFVAATYMRGVPVVQVPTTLLAMLDASVGGKTGIDTDAGKNLIGSFHTPHLVVIDPLVLRTLPAGEFRAGMAEAVKHGAILDAEYFDAIERDAELLLSGDVDAILRLVARSIELKAGVVAEDPFEQGRRAILNFGHTIGHALEKAAAYSIPHGVAVAAGMVAEAAIGEALGVTERGTADRLTELLKRLGLPARLPQLPPDFNNSLLLDKKARRSEPRFALLRRIGESAQNDRGEWTHEVAAGTLSPLLQQLSGDVRYV